MPVAIIGAGAVGATLGQAWLKHGQTPYSRVLKEPIVKLTIDGARRRS